MKLTDIIEKLYLKKNLYTSKDFFKKSLYWLFRLFRPFSKTVYVVGCPEYPNLGDSAILIAELAFLKESGFTDNRIKCITEREFFDDRQVIRSWIGKKKLICGLGGGNMGNQYYSEEKIRRILLKDFSENPIIIFPQTIYYGGTTGAEEAEESKRYYDNKENLTLIAREKKSQEEMQRLYPGTKVLLTPDIVLSCTMKDFEVESNCHRKGVLLCVRSDAEKSMSDAEFDSFTKKLQNYGIICKKTDMYSDKEINSETRLDCIKRKMEEFVSAQIVITDRLHGMIFAAITETPCIVFSNYNHKVKGTYDWIKHLPYIKFAETIEEAEAYVPDLLTITDCRFDNERLLPLYNPIKEIIQDYLNK
ncbi:MAG: polysaccharide pyruvyl transferase family protein [Clostridia bacterium]|nr:polysaccharide pyruvyl transferase family protein [Clostridia bacterium]